MMSHRLTKSFLITLRALKKWNREVFGLTHCKITKLEKELESIQSALIVDKRR